MIKLLSRPLNQRIIAVGIICFSLSSLSSQANALPLNVVPADGLESLDEVGFHFYKELGPLQFAARQVPMPEYPVWRIYMAMQPVLNPERGDSLAGYTVAVDRLNLSPDLYAELRDSYGEENTDPSLNNTTPADRYDLQFTIVQNLPADPLLEDAHYGDSLMAGKACGLQMDCARLLVPDKGDWGEGQAVTLEAAPWEKTPHPSASLVRALAQHTGWLSQLHADDSTQWSWVTPEIPEGIHAERPWVELTLDNYSGNGGVWVADWVERVADDSVVKVLTRLVIAEGETEGTVYRAYLCARGEEREKPIQFCP